MSTYAIVQVIRSFFEPNYTILFLFFYLLLAESFIKIVNNMNLYNDFVQFLYLNIEDAYQEALNESNTKTQ
jgi:hypothetical protein